MQYNLTSSYNELRGMLTCPTMYVGGGSAEGLELGCRDECVTVARSSYHNRIKCSSPWWLVTSLSKERRCKKYYYLCSVFFAADTVRTRASVLCCLYMYVRVVLLTIKTVRLSKPIHCCSFLSLQTGRAWQRILEPLQPKRALQTKDMQKRDPPIKCQATTAMYCRAVHCDSVHVCCSLVIHTLTYLFWQVTTFQN